jgi:septum formation protein
MDPKDGLPLILASASPRRQEMLRSMGIAFEVIPSGVEEMFLRGESPGEHVNRLARMKARKVAEQHRGRWVLAADTIVVVDGRVLGKPQDREEAEEMLRLLNNRVHRVITGYCLLRAPSRKSRVGKVVTRVRFKALSSEEIRWYLDTGEPFDKAGAYAIQGKAAFMVKSINGSYTNVVGLPLTEVVEAVQDLGAANLFG